MSDQSCYRTGFDSTGTTSRNRCDGRGRIISIEVCQGPDCSGLGGGAALLEIEELVQEVKYQYSYQYKCNDGGAQDQQSSITGIASVVSDMSIVGVELGLKEREDQSNISIKTIVGGCRDFCTVGPNVHILEYEQETTAMPKSIEIKNRRRRKKEQNALVESFEYVNDISNCQKVINTAVSTLLQKNYDTNSGMRESDAQGECHGEQQQQQHQKGFAQSMMARRAERLRWEALKAVSRNIAKCKKTLRHDHDLRQFQRQEQDRDQKQKDLRKINAWKESCRDELTKAHRAELSATHSSASTCVQHRAHRRAKRLRQIMEDRMDSCLRSNITDISRAEYSDSSDSDDSNT